MEPFSATASALAVMALCTTVGRGTVNLVKALHRAPLELILLSNEVNDLKTVLNEAAHAFIADLRAPQDQTSDELSSVDRRVNFATRIVDHISLAREEIQELDTMIKTLQTSDRSGGRIEVDNIQWTLKKKSAQRLQKRLRHRVQKLVQLLKPGQCK